MILKHNNYKDTKEYVNALEKTACANYEVMIEDSDSTDFSGQKLIEGDPGYTLFCPEGKDCQDKPYVSKQQYCQQGFKKNQIKMA